MTSAFKNKVVWITGASSGIGEALVYAFSALGSKIVLSSRNEEELVRVMHNCKCSPEDIFILPLDLTQSHEFNSKAEMVVNHFGGIDIMIHNAGIASRDRVENTDMTVVRKIMETNFFGTVGLTKAVLPFVRKSEKGRFVVILSLSAMFGAPLLSSYAASKHALVGFFESFRAESGNEGLGIHLMVPGFINTPILVKAIDGQGNIRGKNLAVNEKGMSPEKCASLIVKAIQKEKKLAMIGGSATVSVLMYRLFPSLFKWVLRNHPIKMLRQKLPWFFK